MKRIISLVLLVIICVSLCACGGKSKGNSKNDKYVGTYVGPWCYTFEHIPWGELGSTYVDKYNSYRNGEVTFTLNSDGTGTLRFVSDDLALNDNEHYSHVEKEIFNCPITWEVVDEYLYLSGSCESKYDTEPIEIDEKMVLEGKDLKYADGDGYWRYRKQ